MMFLSLLACVDEETHPAEGRAGSGSPPEVVWHAGLGTEFEEHVHEGHQTTDGGSIAIGHAQESSGNTTDMLVVKASASGDQEWLARVGSAGEWDVGVALLEVEDGFWAAGGLTEDGQQRAAVVKLDRDGDVVWTQTFSDEGPAAVRGLDQMADGRVVITGYQGGTEPGFVFISEEGTGFLKVLEPDGEVVWSADLPVTQGTKVRETPDGGFAVLSTDWVFADGADVQNAILVRTDANGEVLWREAFGGANNNQAFDFDMGPDGDFVLAGHTTGFGAANWDCLMLKVSADGDLEWSRRFGQPRGYDPRFIHDECYGVRFDHDGGFVMAGGSGDEYSTSEDGHPSGSSDEWKGYVVKVAADGELDWAQIYGDGAGNGNNATEFIALTDDGGYLLFNDTDSAGPAEPSNFGFMKLE